MTLDKLKESIKHIKDVVYIPLNNDNDDVEELEWFYSFLDDILKDYELDISSKNS